MTSTPPRIGWTVAGCLLFIGIVLAAFVANVTRPTGPSAQQLEAAGVFLLPAPRELPQFALTGTASKPFGRDSLLGAPPLARAYRSRSRALLRSVQPGK